MVRCMQIMKINNFSSLALWIFFSFFYFSQLVAYLSYLLMTDAMGLNY